MSLEGEATCTGNGSEPALGPDDVIIKHICDGGRAREAVAQWCESNDVNRVLKCNKDKITTLNSTFMTKSRTVLHFAAFFGQKEIVADLLSKKANPAHTNDDGENALHAALDCEHGDETIAKITKLLLSDSDDTDSDDQVRPNCEEVLNGAATSGFTPLITAVYLDLKKTVKALLDKKPDLTIGFESAHNIICYAAEHDGFVLEMLLKHEELKPKIPEALDKVYGQYTPLHKAVLKHQRRSVELLVHCGANVKIRDTNNSCPIHYTFETASFDDFKGMVFALKKSIDEQDGEGNTILHYLVLHNKTEFIQFLRKDAIDANITIQNNRGRRPIHYLCEHRGNEHLVNLLTNEHVLCASDNKGYTALHYAVQQNDHKLVRVLLRAKSRAVDPRKQLVRGQTSIHLAAIGRKGNEFDFENMLCVFKDNMHKSEFKELIDMKTKDGKTALILAIEHRQFPRASVLLHKDFCADLSIQDGDKRNCLHYAFLKSAPANLIKKILDRCSGTQEVPDTHHNIPLQYLTKRTPLEAIRAMKKINLNRTVDSDAETKQSPLIEAIRLKRNEVVKILLVKDAIVETRSLKDAIVKENKDVAHILVRYAGKDNLTAILNEVIPIPKYGDQSDLQPPSGPASAAAAAAAAESRSTSSAYRHNRRKGIRKRGPTTLFRELIYRMPDVAKEVLERCVDVNHTKGQESVSFNYSFIHPPKITEIAGPSDAEGRAGAVRRGAADKNCSLIDPLKLMVDTEQTSLLQHPVVGSYLHLKWNALGFGFYMLNLFLYALFLLCLSLFSLTVNNPLDKVCVQLNTNSTTDMSVRCGSYGNLIATYTFAVCVINLALYHLVKEFIWLIYTWRDYFLDIQNYNELVLYTTSVIFVFVFFYDCGCPRSWQWQLGIFVVFLGWINLIFFASNFPLTGIYVIMFKTIVETFAQLLLFAALLVAAFGLILFMMFHNPEAEVSAFTNIGYSFFTTINMITGGIDFDSLFALSVPPSQYVPIPYHVVNIIMWIVFLVFFPIIFNNLLTSLAVSDVEIIRASAELKKLELQVKIFDKAELILPRWVVREFLKNICSPHEIKFKDESRLDRLSMFIWGGKNYLENIEDDTYAQKLEEQTEEIMDGTTGDEELNQIRERQEELFDLVLSLKASLDSRYAV